MLLVWLMEFESECDEQCGAMFRSLPSSLDLLCQLRSHNDLPALTK